MRVRFRADATRTVGAGHVMRCFALAEEFASRGVTVVWQGSIDLPWLTLAIERNGWEILPSIGSEKEQAAAVSADLVVVDSYTLSNAYRAYLLENGTPVVAIVDDAVPNPGPATLWVNPGVHRDDHLGVGCSFLNGPEFVLIRREIRDLRSMREEMINQGQCATGVTFLLGGTDFANLSDVVDELSSTSDLKQSLYAGPALKKRDQLKSGVRWYPGGSDLLQRAAQSSLVASAAGVTSWEMAHIGVPMALIQTAVNQHGNYSWMTQQGWARPLGSLVSGTEVEILKVQLAQVIAEIDSGEFVGKSHIDGNGAKRVADAAIGLL